MRGLLPPLVLLAGLVGCPDPAPVDATCTDGPTLFGVPEAATGLTDAQCGPSCPCAGGTWEAPTYDEADVAALRAWTPTTPYAPVTDDPYAGAAPADAGADAVCGFVADTSDTYHLETFADADAAAAAGAKVTHTGGCGVCSTLADLAVYVERTDLTEPVRACGLKHMGDTPDELRACIEALGFTTPCAWIWTWNTLHTQEVCLAECIAALDDPYHEADGSLNPCLQCDEDLSGPVFKAVAGRTRRNTGVPNAICRPCSEVTPLEHRYP